MQSRLRAPIRVEKNDRVRLDQSTYVEDVDL